MSCVAQPRVHAEFLITKLMEFLLPCIFPSEEVGCGGEEMACESSLAGKQSRQTKEDEADDLWRGPFYCKRGVVSA